MLVIKNFRGRLSGSLKDSLSGSVIVCRSSLYKRRFQFREPQPRSGIAFLIFWTLVNDRAHASLVIGIISVDDKVGLSMNVSNFASNYFFFARFKAIL